MLRTTKISIVAAIGKNRELGKDNKLLWNIPKDLKHFKEITNGHPIIMGRKTFESIGRPLPNRLNIVITRNKQQVTSDKKYNGVTVVESLEEAIKSAEKHSLRHPGVAESHDRIYSRLAGDSITSFQNDDLEVFIIGGGQIFEQALPFTDRIYLTIVDSGFAADTFFPEYAEFKNVISRQKGKSDSYSYEFLTLEK